MIDRAPPSQLHGQLHHRAERRLTATVLFMELRDKSKALLDGMYRRQASAFKTHAG